MGLGVDTPNVEHTSDEFQQMLNTWLGSQGQIYKSEAEYQPLYADLAATSLLNVAQNSAKQIASTQRAANPANALLLDELTSQASNQLKTNGALDTETRRSLQQNVRGSQAARGLGYGPGDAAMEQFYETQTQEARKSANQSFAQGVAAQNTASYKDPFTVLFGNSGMGISSTPKITSSDLSNSMLGTVYNANAAANIASSNNQTAMLGGLQGMF